MGYINTNILTSKGLFPQDVACLQLIKQNSTEPLIWEAIKAYISYTDIQRYDSAGLITYVNKKKKSQDDLEVLRLSDLGKEILEQLETPEVTEGDIQMRDYLIQMYLNNEDEERVVGNKKKISMYIAVMRGKLGLTLHQFYYLCDLFLKNHTFTKNLEYVFFNSNKNRYGKFKDNMEDSALYQFYDTRKKDIELYWQEKIK